VIGWTSEQLPCQPSWLFYVYMADRAQQQQHCWNHTHGCGCRCSLQLSFSSVGRLMWFDLSLSSHGCNTRAHWTDSPFQQQPVCCMPAAAKRTLQQDGVPT
jgi:hypothetical protein